MLFSKEIKTAWNKAIGIGISNQLSFSQKLRVELSNQFALIALALISIHVLLNFLGPNYGFDYILCGIWMLIFISALFFNYLRKHLIAKWFLIITSIIYIGILHFLFGSNMRYESIYILLIVLSIYLFNRKQAFFLTSTVLFVYLPITIFRLSHEAPYAHLVIETGPIVYFFFSVFITVTLTYKLLKENKDYNMIIGSQNKLLIENNEQLKRFNYIVSHDLKEPLRSIVSFSGLLKKHIDNEEKRKEFLDYIINSGKQLNTLIDDIRNFQDLDQVDIEVEDIDISMVIHEVNESLNRLLHQKNATIEYGVLPQIHSSKSALFILFKNLIENGIKHNKSNRPMIRIEGETSENEVKIFIKDNGIGILPEYHEQVFTMFKRLDATKSKGSGLGLSIAKKTAEKLNGELKIHASTLHQGTTFLVTFPN